MSASKQEKERKSKAQTFKERAKEQAKQAKIPKSYLVPLTEWDSTQVLDLRGDLLDALEQQFVSTYQELQQAKGYLQNAEQEFQKAAHVVQMIMQANIKAGKVRVKYSWNNGEDATEQDIKEFEAKMQEIRDKQQKEFEAHQASLNAEKTGLVDPGGNPIGTTQNLEEETELDQKAEAEEKEAKVELKDEL